MSKETASFLVVESVSRPDPPNRQFVKITANGPAGGVYDNQKLMQVCQHVASAVGPEYSVRVPAEPADPGAAAGQ